MLKKILLVFSLFILSSQSYGEVVKVFEFTENELSNLEEKKVRGAKNKTIFSLGNNENGNFLKAVSSNGGSGIGKEIEIDLEKTPFLNITWKVEKDLSGIDERSKKGHDFAARMFVVKKTGATPLSNRAINFVFSSNEDVNKSWPSPYFSKSIDYVLSSTKEHLNYISGYEKYAFTIGYQRRSLGNVQILRNIIDNKLFGAIKEILIQFGDVHYSFNSFRSEKNIAGVVSQVLILGSIDKEGKVILVHPSQKSENGLPIA